MSSNDKHKALRLTVDDALTLHPYASALMPTCYGASRISAADIKSLLADHDRAIKALHRLTALYESEFDEVRKRPRWLIEALQECAQ